MSVQVRRTIRVTLTIEGREHSLSEDEARSLARQIDDALGGTPRVKRRTKAQTAAERDDDMPPMIHGEWSADDTLTLRDERIKGKSWVLIGELLGRTASECKTQHDRTSAAV
jgi:hypothetical protein